MFGIYDIFKWQGITSPDKVALICGEKRYTYAQLNRRVNCVAYGLQKLGVKKGSQIGIMLYNGVDFVTAFYAGIKLGACVCLFDYRWKTEELEKETETVKCEYFIVEKDMLPQIQQLYSKDEIYVKLITAGKSCIDNFEEFLGNGSGDWDYTTDLAGDDIIFTIFTGGTTGLPKASAHSQQASLVRVLGLLTNSDLINKHDVYLNYAPMFHLSGVGSMLKIFSIGATYCLTSGFTPDIIIDTIAREHVTQMTLLPPTIIDRLKDAKDGGVDISSLRVLQLGGGSSTDATLELAFELLPDVLCVNAYGHSENSLYMTNIITKEQFYSDRDTALLLGKPEPYFEIKLVDENGNEVPVGQPGEAWGRSPAMMSGFIGKPSPFTADGWYPTGDIMYKDEKGMYHFCARCKDMIKSGGENVYAVEVESAITRDNPRIAECAVVGLPDACWGEIIAAAIVLREGETMTEEEVIENCKKYIASYKKPKKVFFLSELPKSSVGKVTKNVLKQQLLACLS